jgi:hypothetical protein
MLYSIVSSLLITAIGVVGIQLPNLTGLYPVGSINLELIDNSRTDQLAPTPQPRDIMISMFYPTSEAAANAGTYNFSPYLSPKTAASLDTYFGTSKEILDIVTKSYDGAPIKSNDFPLLIFSPGYGASRFIYTALLEDLASHGWIIVAVDHPYDAKAVEFPSGEVVLELPSNLDDFPKKMPSLVEIRVADLEFVANALESSTLLSQIPGLASPGGTLRSNHIGVFGGSLGGATAAQAMSNFTQFACGANFDGGIFGPVAEVGLDRPFLQLEAQGHNRTNDATWALFWEHLTGFRRELTVNGTVHLTFTDIPLIRDLLGEAFPAQLRNQSGTIAGERILQIETAIIDAFFAFCLKGKSVDELDSLARGKLPEVSFP